MGPRQPYSTVLTLEQEAMIVAFCLSLYFLTGELLARRHVNIVRRRAIVGPGLANGTGRAEDHRRAKDGRCPSRLFLLADPTFDGLQGIFENGLNTVALADEAAREIKVHPAVVLALVDSPCRATPALREVHRQPGVA